jgi:anaerobic magnesium-protoporphyrin IX monomethyl ester cyclase
MRILFIYKDVNLSGPSGILSLSAVLRAAGHETGLALAERRGFLSRVRDFNPDVLAYSVTTGFHRFYLDINRQLRADLARNGKRVLSLFGGPHATFFPEMIEAEGVDMVCRGEGEDVIVDLANALGRGDDYSRIENLWVKNGAGIIRNDMRPLIENLDRLPFPDRDLLFTQDRFTRDSPMKIFFPNRGCPYLCTYCFNHKYNELYRGKGDIIRHRSVGNLLAEIRDVRARWPLKFIFFLSDNFILDREWVNEFADRYRREINLPFSCNVRANLVDEKVASDLKKAGCLSVIFGVESGDEHLRNDILKRQISDEIILSAGSLLRAQGIHLYTQNILALPGETFQQALQTLNLNQQLRPSYAWASIFQPYPSNELTDYAIQNGYFDGNSDRVDYTFHGRTAMKFSSRRERRMFTNLHRLFGIMAEWPSLGKYARALCAMPLTPIYSILYKLWYGYTNRYRIYPYPLSMREFLMGLFRFFRKDTS